MEKDFEIIKNKFEGAEAQAQMALKRCYKDKREYFELYNDIDKNLGYNNARITSNNDFIKRMTDKINALVEVQKIDISLYSQDELDKNLTKLYGFDKAAGIKPELGRPTSPLTVNNNCISCSGNAQFINKAFKLACLSYNSSKVSYENELYDKAELLKKKIEYLSFPKLCVT